MKITYDEKADAANIVFQKGKYHISKEIGEGVIVDYTKDGKIISIEILNVSKRVPTKSLKHITSVSIASA
ncbi:MAG: DUF2283 domain-containing protein [Candidatus Micrarchaeota archaeon]|nr:DUF2283 domain-containing protein [Candidatus Micrarchaeota archaeon]MDE1849580.1 DUF2283 domain-containing protein [Candidatus Micrarchaeota archaeon]